MKKQPCVLRMAASVLPNVPIATSYGLTSRLADPVVVEFSDSVA
jgi:hypothetical protein